MKMKTALLGVAVSAMVGGAPALAGGIELVAEPMITADSVPQASDWSGGYFGLQVGSPSGDLGLIGRNLSSTNTTSEDIDVSGQKVGVFAGYNWAGGNGLVYGIEGEYNFGGLGSVDGSSDGVPPPNFNFIRNGIDADIGATGAVRGRLGVAIYRGLLYGTAGLAFATVNLDGTTGTGLPGPFNPSEMLTGWTVGAGYEYAFNNDWSMRIEYRYSDLEGNFDFTGGGGSPHDFELDLLSHQARIGVAYRF